MRKSHSETIKPASPAGFLFLIHRIWNWRYAYARAFFIFPEHLGLRPSDKCLFIWICVHGFVGAKNGEVNSFNMALLSANIRNIPMHFVLREVGE